MKLLSVGCDNLKDDFYFAEIKTKIPRGMLKVTPFMANDVRMVISDNFDRHNVDMDH